MNSPAALSEAQPTSSPAPTGDALLLEVKNLRTYFFYDEGTVKAVDGASFNLESRKVLGVVGESGCGKSVTAQSILGILGPGGRIVEGEILFRRDGNVIDLARLNPKGEEFRSIRGKDIALIFQEPMSSFSPVFTIGQQMIEAILVHTDLQKEGAREKAIDMLRMVGIPDPQRRVDAYSWQLSGGMRQRAMIATALSCNPSLLIADEPTTALDVTIQAQILDLMVRLQREIGMAIMLITHNMGVIAQIAHHVVVMYLGAIVESASVEELFHHPKHPYTAALLRSIPRLGRSSGTRLESIRGMVPDPYNLPKGCKYHPRCPRWMKGLCEQRAPECYEVSPQHSVSCFLYGGEHGQR